MEIAAPLQAWYSTPAGEEPNRDLAEGEGEIDLEMVEEAMESGDASAPDDALGDPAESEPADGDAGHSGTEQVAAPGATESSGSSTTWVAPVVVAGVAATGIGALTLRRRRTADA